MLAIGLMSGTSLDGIDVSLIRTNGDDELELVADYHRPYEVEFQEELRNVLKSSRPWWKVERKLTQLHADAVKYVMDKERQHGRVEIIGFHGQTVSHQPNERFTWQLGDSSLLASLVGCDVVGDFRRRDIAYGGQGAPLVPVYHRALVEQSRFVEKPVLIVNIGGVANFTYVGENELIAFDCGPGNALIDDMCAKLKGLQFDEHGKIALQGHVNERLVEEYLMDEFFDLSPPKSLDRNHFCHLTSGRIEEMSDVDDQIATISYFTVASIIYSIKKHLLEKGRSVKRALVCGGGAKNRFIMNTLAVELGPSGVKCTTIEEIGLNPDFIESQAFAYLAVRFMRRLPTSLPTTTGVSRPVTGGAYFPFE